MDSPVGEERRPQNGWPQTDSMMALDGVQAVEGEPDAEGGLGQGAAPRAEADTKPSEPPAGDSQHPPSLAADSATEDARIEDQAPQGPQADPAPEQETTEYDLSAEEELIKNWPTLDKAAGGFRARRWPLLLVTLVAVGGGSLYAVRIVSTKSRALASSRSASPGAAALTASGLPAIEGGQGVAKQAGAQSADQVTGIPPTAAPASPLEPVAAPTDADAKSADADEGEPGGQFETASGETPSPTADGHLAQPPTVGAVPPPTEGPVQRCRKADAGGKGRPSRVLAACRPAIEAEPEAADVMVMLARAAIDLGRADEAQSWANKALHIRRDLPDAYVFLGGAEQQMGRPAEAKAAYRKYLALAPTGRHASELRKVLERL